MEQHMGWAADFFVSYTSPDRAWAEWIAWQLEADGYKVVVQAWDFIAGRDWAHEMQQATVTAERVVVVLSAAYLKSGHGEAEWRTFYAKDPSGERGLLLPVRVDEVDPPGLLKTRVYVDLAGRDPDSARAALLAAARSARGKPTKAPEFPGDRQSEVNANEAPQFPAVPPMAAVAQHIRFCTAPDGVRLAFATHGQGPPLVRASTWLTHLEFDWHGLLWRHWLEGLADGHTVVRYDERGCGLSDRDVEALSLEAWVSDLETVVDAANLDRFPLLGVSQGGPVAVAYAVRHPERVSHLVLCGTYARGRFKRGVQLERQEAELLISMVRAGWGRGAPAFRRAFTMMFIPGATPEQMSWFDELQRISTSPETAARIRLSRGKLDVADLARRVTVPTLVLHARDDLVVPFAEGRLLASLIPSAQFVPLEGRNHILLADEPAWPIFLTELHGFLASS
jgi:pimeloyl-ACP methyl ester carboxylesterase